MTKLPAEIKKNLPTIEQLYNEKIDVEKQTQLNLLLNSNPSEKWLKPHPSAKRKVVRNGQTLYEPILYMPIERHEWLLTNIFLKWRTEVKDTKLIANSVVVTVRVHYQDPLTAEWYWQDGIGGKSLQTDKGAGANDWTKIKDAAVMMAAPAAESYAIKDACEKIGRIFGSNINRADEAGYESLARKLTDDKIDTEYAHNLIDAAITNDIFQYQELKGLEDALINGASPEYIQQEATKLKQAIREHWNAKMGETGYAKGDDVEWNGKVMQIQSINAWGKIRCLQYNKDGKLSSVTRVIYIDDLKQLSKDG